MSDIALTVSVLAWSQWWVCGLAMLKSAASDLG